MRVIPTLPAGWAAGRNHSPRVTGFAWGVVQTLLITGLLAGTVMFTLRMDAGPPPRTPQPHPDCVEAVYAAGNADWYCGRTITVPRGARVFAPNMPPCLSDDGSGPLPCRWDATTQGHTGRDGKHHGTSFTVLPDGAPVNGSQRVLFRYDTGSTIVTIAPAS